MFFVFNCCQLKIYQAFLKVLLNFPRDKDYLRHLLSIFRHVMNDVAFLKSSSELYKKQKKEINEHRMKTILRIFLINGTYMLPTI